MYCVPSLNFCIIKSRSVTSLDRYAPLREIRIRVDSLLRREEVIASIQSENIRQGMNSTHGEQENYGNFLSASRTRCLLIFYSWCRMRDASIRHCKHKEFPFFCCSKTKMRRETRILSSQRLDSDEDIHSFRGP